MTLDQNASAKTLLKKRYFLFLLARSTANLFQLHSKIRK